RSLPGIAPTLLTQRLRTLIDEDLVATKELPPPIARSVYTITTRGRTVVPVMRALAKWGMPLLEEPSEDQVIRPWMSANVFVGAAYYDPDEAHGIDERYVLRIDGEEVELSSVRGRREALRPRALTLESDSRVWADIRQGRTTIKAAIKDGRIRRTGSAAALGR